MVFFSNNQKKLSKRVHCYIRTIYVLTLSLSLTSIQGVQRSFIIYEKMNKTRFETRDRYSNRASSTDIDRYIWSMERFELGTHLPSLLMAQKINMKETISYKYISFSQQYRTRC